MGHPSPIFGDRSARCLSPTDRNTIRDLTGMNRRIFPPAVAPASKMRPGFRRAACSELTLAKAGAHLPAKLALSAIRNGAARICATVAGSTLAPLKLS